MKYKNDAANLVAVEESSTAKLLSSTAAKLNVR